MKWKAIRPTLPENEYDGGCLHEHSTIVEAAVCAVVFSNVRSGRDPHMINCKHPQVDYACGCPRPTPEEYNDITHRVEGLLSKQKQCSKQGCEKPSTGQVWGDLVYETCDEHRAEIKDLTASE